MGADLQKIQEIGEHIEMVLKMFQIQKTFLLRGLLAATFLTLHSSGLNWPVMD